MIDNIIKAIQPLDSEWKKKAMTYCHSLAMPPGALGQVQESAIQLATIQKTLKPRLDKKTLVMSCADHGIAAEGVSAYPQITDAIVKTALAGGAAINAFCRQSGTDLLVVDVGVKGLRQTGKKSLSIQEQLTQINQPFRALDHQLEEVDFIQQSIAAGTANMLHEPAMTVEQCEQALQLGIEISLELDADIVALGEMGIANTTSASCLLAKFADLSAVEVTGPGTGVQGQALEHKTQVIAAILEKWQGVNEAFEILRHVGGLEIALMSGLILGAASRGKPIMLDGFISGAAALVAVNLAPACQDYLFAGHVSAEPAHKIMLDQLDLKPLLNLDLRLGEGTGAALAMNVLEVACDSLNSMMTLDEALKL